MKPSSQSMSRKEERKLKIAQLHTRMSMNSTQFTSQTLGVFGSHAPVEFVSEKHASYTFFNKDKLDVSMPSFYDPSSSESLSQLQLAVRSIGAYIERASHFIGKCGVLIGDSVYLFFLPLSLSFSLSLLLSLLPQLLSLPFLRSPRTNVFALGTKATYQLR